VFTARYALSPYIKRIRFVFKGLSGRGAELTTHLHPALRLRMSGAIPLLPLRALIVWTRTTLPFYHTCPSPGIFHVVYVMTWTVSRQQVGGICMKIEHNGKSRQSCYHIEVLSQPSRTCSSVSDSNPAARSQGKWETWLDKKINDRTVSVSLSRRRSPTR
jgi:hypothetical protein